MKKCEMCAEVRVFGKSRFCEECKKVRKRESNKKYEDKVKDTKIIKRRQELEENFLKINPTGIELVQYHFDRLSEISASSYAKFFKIHWLDVLEYFGRYEDLKGFLVKEYVRYYKETGSKSVTDMMLSINGQVTIPKMIGAEHFYKAIGANPPADSDEDYRVNFENIKNALGRIPHYNEFIEHSNLQPSQYGGRFKLKGIVYDSIVKMYATEEEFVRYKEHQQKVKSEVGRSNHQGYKHSDEDLKNELKRVFDEYIALTGVTPPGRVFNRISYIDDSVYRSRFKMSFGEIAEMYGYNFYDSINKSEKLVVDSVGELLGEAPERQKSFEWLMSVKNYPLRCDGYYPNSRVVIEFDGRQHDEPVDAFGGEEAFKMLKKNDGIKDTLIPQHGLILVRVSCYDPFWDKDFLRIRLYENGVILPNHAIISDTAHKDSKTAQCL